MGETFDHIQLPIFHVGDYDKKQDLGDVKRGPVNFLLWLVLPFWVWSPDTPSCKHRPQHGLKYIRTVPSLF
jgi:hypothetical protein